MTKFIKYFIPFLLIFAAACSGGEKEHVEPATATTVPTLESTTTTVLDYEQMFGKADELANMSDEQCESIDRYAFMEISTPQSQSDGSEWDYICSLDQWGYFFNGNAGDEWRVQVPGKTGLQVGESTEQSADSISFPKDRHHPYFKDALVATDLVEGAEVCIRPNSGIPEDAGMTLVVNRVFWAITYYGNGETIALPKVSFYPDSSFGPEINQMVQEGVDMSFYGIIPTETGKWYAGFWVSLGQCPETTTS